MVMVTGHIPGIAIEHPPGPADEAIPDAFAFPIFIKSAFDLVG